MPSSLYHSSTNKFEICYCINRTVCETIWNRKERRILFPTPERVANISIEELREQKFSQRKAEYIVGLGQSIASSTLNLASIETRAEEEVSAQLLPIRGLVHGQCKIFNVWAWTENMFPKADIGIQRAVQGLFQLDDKPDDAF